MRGGTYHEIRRVFTAGITIQAYPGEVVWMDGTVPVTGWVQDGTAWRHDNWNVSLDSSPTFTRGAPDGTAVELAVREPELPDGGAPRPDVRERRRTP